MSDSSVLTQYGEIANDCWLDLPRHYPHVSLDTFVVMPNHVHGIVVLEGAPQEGLRSSATNVAGRGVGLKPSRTRHGLPEVVRAFKSFSARRINELQRVAGRPVWQRSYYEHVLRSSEDLEHAQEYILANPAQWAEDVHNPWNA